MLNLYRSEILRIKSGQWVVVIALFVPLEMLLDAYLHSSCTWRATSEIKRLIQLNLIH